MVKHPGLVSFNHWLYLFVFVVDVSTVHCVHVLSDEFWPTLHKLIGKNYYNPYIFEISDTIIWLKRHDLNRCLFLLFNVFVSYFCYITVCVILSLCNGGLYEHFSTASIHTDVFQLNQDPLPLTGVTRRTLRPQTLSVTLTSCSAPSPSSSPRSPATRDYSRT